jgi:hypothetical protein
MKAPLNLAILVFLSARNNPLVGLLVSVFSGISAFVICLAGIAALTRILSRDLNDIAAWAVVGIGTSLAIAFLSFFFPWKVLNRA